MVKRGLRFALISSQLIESIGKKNFNRKLELNRPQNVFDVDDDAGQLLTLTTLQITALIFR